MLPLIYKFRRICPLYTWSRQDNGMAVARKWSNLLLSQRGGGAGEKEKKEKKTRKNRKRMKDSRCAGSARWPRSNNDDTPNVCKHTVSFFPYMICHMTLQVDFWCALWVNVVGLPWWVPCYGHGEIIVLFIR